MGPRIRPGVGQARCESWFSLYKWYSAAVLLIYLFHGCQARINPTNPNAGRERGMDMTLLLVLVTGWHIAVNRMINPKLKCSFHQTLISVTCCLDSGCHVHLLNWSFLPPIPPIQSMSELSHSEHCTLAPEDLQSSH